MRASTAYFAGAGTVVVALMVGLGGGAMMADIMNPQGTREASKLEQRLPQQAHQTAQPSSQNAVTNGSQTPAPYLAATEQASSAPVVVSPAPSSSPQPPNQANANNAPATDARPAAAREQSSTPENAYAKAQDADVKRSADEKRKADRAERRQKRAARRQQQRGQQQRDADAQMRDGSEPDRNIIVQRDDSWRNDFRPPTRMDVPRFNLFDQD